MSANYSIMLRMDGKKALVIGGGKVAERKVAGLLSAKADITVVSPKVTAGLAELAQLKKIIWQQKNFSNSDVEEAFLIFAATDDAEVNLKVKMAAGSHQLVTISDAPDESDFHVPAVVQRGRLSLAVSTDGASPVLAKKIRNQLFAEFDERYEEYLDFLFEARKRILKEINDAALKRKLLTALAEDQFLNSDHREDEFRNLLEKVKKQTL